jgi:hypothetical protein
MAWVTLLEMVATRRCPVTLAPLEKAPLISIAPSRMCSSIVRVICAISGELAISSASAVSALDSSGP